MFIIPKCNNYDQFIKQAENKYPQYLEALILIHPKTVSVRSLCASPCMCLSSTCVVKLKRLTHVCFPDRQHSCCSAASTIPVFLYRVFNCHQ